jgi:hypothetical protein
VKNGVFFVFLWDCSRIFNDIAIKIGNSHYSSQKLGFWLCEGLLVKENDCVYISTELRKSGAAQNLVEKNKL